MAAYLVIFYVKTLFNSGAKIATVDLLKVLDIRDYLNGITFFLTIPCRTYSFWI